MTAAFDLYTKRTRLFYITGGITAVMLIVSLTGWVTNVQLPKILMGFVDAFLLLGGLTMPVFVILAASGWFITYVKDGELILEDDYLEIDTVKIHIAETLHIKLRAGSWSRKRAGNIVGNRVEVTDKNGNIYKRRFVIKTLADSEAFEKITGEWYKKGYVFDLVYHG